MNAQCSVESICLSTSFGGGGGGRLALGAGGQSVSRSLALVLELITSGLSNNVDLEKL